MALFRGCGRRIVRHRCIDHPSAARIHCPTVDQAVDAQIDAGEEREIAVALSVGGCDGGLCLECVARKTETANRVAQIEWEAVIGTRCSRAAAAAAALAEQSTAAHTTGAAAAATALAEIEEVGEIERQSVTARVVVVIGKRSRRGQSGIKLLSGAAESRVQSTATTTARAAAGEKETAATAAAAAAPAADDAAARAAARDQSVVGRIGGQGAHFVLRGAVNVAAGLIRRTSHTVEAAQAISARLARSIAFVSIDLTTMAAKIENKATTQPSASCGSNGAGCLSTQRAGGENAAIEYRAAGENAAIEYSSATTSRDSPIERRYQDCSTTTDEGASAAGLTKDHWKKYKKNGQPCERHNT